MVTGLSVIVIGKVSDGNGRKEKVMVLGFALNAFFTFCYIFVSTPLELLLVQAGIGYATALATPTWRALYDKYSEDKLDGYIWGLASGGAYIVAGIAALIGGMIVSHYSFTALLISMGSIQVVATLYQAKILRRKKL
ncbi:MAG: MFS transporter [Patescibacteria group bacterium]|nr:MFS transporter [Patescibacteria group bacterium]